MVKQPMKSILIVENVLGLYRNYAFVGKIHRFFMMLRTIFEISLIVICFTMIVFFEKVSMDPEYCYCLATMVHSLMVLVLSVYHTEKFRKWMRYNNIFDSNFHSDKIYLRKIALLKRYILLCIIILNMIQGSATSFYVMYGHDVSFTSNNYIMFSEYIFCFTMVLCEYRLIFELPFMYFFDVFTAEQIDCITRSVDDYIKLREQIYDDNGPSGMKLQIFDKWSASYIIVGKKTKLCRSIFGIQLTMLIGLVTIFYILLMYAIITLGVKEEYSPLLLGPYCIALSELLVSLYVLSRAKQRALNSAETLRRRLAVLYIRSVECESECKAARDLLRQVRAHPIEMRASGSIAVDMRLLPAIISFCTTYTVITLQFNNIV